MRANFEGLLEDIRTQAKLDDGLKGRMNEALGKYLDQFGD